MRMSDLISGSELRQAISDGQLIRDGDVASVENVKYDFHMGERVLKAEVGQPMAISEMTPQQRFVYPGEAVFVLSQERLDLPKDVMALLVPKRKFSHFGMLVLGGLAVDPKYKGYLLLGLYNFSSTPFPLQAGKKIIGALFYRLGSEQIDEAAPTPEEVTDFPDELVALIRNYKPIELSGLETQLADLRRELASLKADIDRDEKWREDVKGFIDQHNRQLDKLLEGLAKEEANRLAADEKLNERLERMSTMFVGLNLTKKIGFFLLAAAVGAAITYFVTKALGS
jgi:dCTP deaminase